MTEICETSQPFLRLDFLSENRSRFYLACDTVFVSVHCTFAVWHCKTSEAEPEPDSCLTMPRIDPLHASINPLLGGGPHSRSQRRIRGRPLRN